MKRFRKSAIALVLALLMALQGTEPIFVQAKEAIEDVQKNADFSRPEALTEEEAGITDSTSGEQDKSQQSDADVQNETTPSEDTETQEEQTTPAEETEENPQEKEVELKEPQDYYPIPEEPEGELVHFLVRNEKQNKSYAYDKEVPNSKKAILHYRLIGHSENYYLLEVDLKTGRHHQIRCQLAKMGCPIKGDLKYGSPRSNPDGSICLHARRVRFVHPVSKELIELEAPLPEGNLWKGFAID
mgnify:CR=1 FL=1